MTHFQSQVKIWAAACLLSSLLVAGCGKEVGKPKEYAYISAQEAFLRDQLSTVFKKVGKVQNGDRVEVLEKSRRFVRVRNQANEMGWIEQRYLAGAEVYQQCQKLAAEHVSDVVQAPGTARFATNLHVTPEREGDHLYQLKEGTKLELLERTTSEKPVPERAAQSKPVVAKKARDKGKEKSKEKDEASKPMEDWWLVRLPAAPGTSTPLRVGWVLARMVDVDVPIEIGQYAEGQRIIAFFVLNQVADLDRQIPQYVVAANEPHDGAPFDFNQIRVFSWNVKKHRYETAYRERKLQGVLPIRVGEQAFDNEGKLPIFLVRVKDDSGNVDVRTYKLNGVMVRRVLPPGQEKPKPAAKTAPARRRRKR